MTIRATHLSCNFKGKTTSVELSPCVVVTGANRSGKTAILEAVRRALTPRPGAGQASKFFEFAPEGADRLYSSLVMSDGSEAEFQVLMGPSGPKAPSQRFTGSLDLLSSEDKAKILPASSMRELIDLGAAKGREALFSRFGNLDGKIPEPILVGDDERKMWDNCLYTASIGKSDPADVLAAQASSLRSAKLNLGKQAKELESRITSLRERCERASVGIELLPELEAKYGLAVAWEQAAPIRAQLHAARKAQTDIEVMVRTETSDPTLGPCPTCHTPGVNVTLSKYKAQLQDMDRRVFEIEEYLGEVADYHGPSSVELAGSIRTMRDGLSARKLYEETQIAHRLAVQQQAIAKSLEQRAGNLLQDLLQRVSTNAEHAVNRYMPIGFTARLDVTDNNCEWKIIGQDGNAHGRTSMSGSERAILIVALALAWTEGAPLRVLLLDDDDLGPLGVSPQNLNALLARLKAAVDEGALSQVIATGVRESDVPSGWAKLAR